eukprot:TRINITY_DN4817_c0_g1_i5.p1 TRINITY_DN4817_c0_g1~~TRINITY_DN4817_c0_g1_i5.p1  ORF type:complete len:461 (-),score=32.59 TRINITY_DN4817_c0_g1_i5:31-1413(-)
MSEPPFASRSKMKIKVISRSQQEYTRQNKDDVPMMQRNIDPTLHPFEKAREYTRALNAVKLDKVFAKPFLYSLDSHSDGIYCMNSVQNSLIHLVSGACDGELRMWDLSFRKTLWNVKAHAGFVRGVVSDPSGQKILTCGDDRTVKIWNAHPNLNIMDDEKITPISTFLGKHAFVGLDHQWGRSELFATAGVALDLWDINRSEPVSSLVWGADSVRCCKFNPSETHILLSAASDRSIVLHDARTRSSLRKLVLKMSTNAIAWNPMEPIYFVTANEDYNCYSFDMRKLNTALCVHKDHVSAVMAIDYSPTGREFVTGGYDRMIRIFPSNQIHSREVYHTKRMQRIFAVKYSADNKYVVSGSDDTNIRLWKAQASEPLKPLVVREKKKLDYYKSLKKRFSAVPEIKRIANHRHVPKAILNAHKLHSIMRGAAERKLRRVMAHRKPGAVVRVPERKAAIVAEHS